VLGKQEINTIVEIERDSDEPHQLAKDSISEHGQLHQKL